MGFANTYGKKYSVGDTIEMNGTKYQILDFKMSGMVVVRNLSKQDAWVYQVLSADSLGLRRAD